MNAGKVMVGTALLLITVALIAHPAEAAGTGAIPLAGVEERIFSPEPVATSIQFSDTAQGGKDNFLHSVIDTRCVNPTIVQNLPVVFHKH